MTLKSIITVATFSILSAHNTFAETVEIKDICKQYNLKIDYKKAACDSGDENISTDLIREIKDNPCRQPATVDIFFKGKSTPFTTIKLDHLAPDPSNEATGLGVMCQDYNFDGREDLAFSSGQTGLGTRYIRNTYAFYLFDPITNTFSENRELSQISENYGMIEVEPKMKTLTINAYSGAANLLSGRTYQWLKSKLTLVETREEELIDDKTDTDGWPLQVKLTTKKLVNGKWKTNQEVQKPSIAS